MSLTWLHISDFHIRGGDPYDRDVVLRALVKFVATRPPDLIFATGDIADSGKKEEYVQAGKFFDELLRAAKLDKTRLFVIPGNHDVDRDLGKGLQRTLASREEADAYFRPKFPKPHLTQKLSAFLKWHNRYFKGLRVAPDDSTCGPVQTIEINGHRLGILPINSALFCQDDNDHDKLWIGRRCLDTALAELKAAQAELNIALIHHPLDWLNGIERANIKSVLKGATDIVLRGHLHETEIEGGLLHFAAGAAYQTRKWPNRSLYVTFNDNRLLIHPIRYEDSPQEIWTIDPSVFPKDQNYERSFPIPRLTQAHIPSNIAARGNRPFVGRDHQIASISKEFSSRRAEAVVVLHGTPGVGKSELAREFARQHRGRYTGGTFWIDASTEAVAIDLASIGKNVLGLNFPSGLPLDDQGRQTFHALGKAPTLLIYDNVVSFVRIEPWLPFTGMPCHVLVTTLLDTPTPAWPCIEVPKLSPGQSLVLVEQLAGAELAAQYGPAIVKHADGLPVQIVPEATTLLLDQRRNRPSSVSPGPVGAAGASFRNAYQRLDQPARLLLHAAALLNPQRILSAELSRHLRNGLGWTDEEFRRALDASLDLHLLDGAPDPSMHQLFAAFISKTALSAEDNAALSRIRTAQKERFVAVAEAVGTNPADTQMAITLISYPITPEAWELSTEEGEMIGRALYEIGRFSESRPWFERSVAEKQIGRSDHASLGISLHNVGHCLSSMGKSEEARPWFERAVTETEKGDLHGRIDYESLGRSLHQVGYCLWSTENYAEALPWFDRAVTAKQKGDVWERIDYESLGTSLHQVGHCLSSRKQYAEAQPWFERAVTAKQRGDVYGRIDHASLGISLHQLGYCLSSAGQHAEAQLWFERAVVEKEQGDVYRRIDHESLGRSLHRVGYCLSSTGKFAEALPWFERAVSAKEKGDVYGRINHKSLCITLRSGAACLRKLNQPDRAAEWEQKAAALEQSPR